MLAEPAPPGGKDLPRATNLISVNDPLALRGVCFCQENHMQIDVQVLRDLIGVRQIADEALLLGVCSVEVDRETLQPPDGMSPCKGDNGTRIQAPRQEGAQWNIGHHLPLDCGRQTLANISYPIDHRTRRFRPWDGQCIVPPSSYNYTVALDGRQARRRESNGVRGAGHHRYRA